MVNNKLKRLSVFVVVALGVVALGGCNGGSPPTNVKVAVTGQVLVLQEDGTAAGQAGVTVTLTSGSHVYSGVTAADGSYHLSDVLAPMTYTVTVSGTGVKASKLRALAVTVPAGGAGAEFRAPTIYVTPEVPAPPAL